MSYTPGPWRREKSYPKPAGYAGVDDINEGVIGDTVVANGFQVAVLPCDYTDYEANANLIAAAPELYEALASAENFLTNHVRSFGGDEEDFPSLVKARAALKKAEDKS